MNVVTEHTSERPVDRWFAAYAQDHQNPVNQIFHCVCVPAIFWSIIALIWCIPPMGTLLKTGVWAALALFVVWMYYYRLSRPLGLGAFVFFFVGCCLCRLIEHRFSLPALFWTGVTVFVVAWIGQFIGHSKLYEGKRPSFFTDLTYLLIGPIWVLSKFYKKMGWKY